MNIDFLILAAGQGSRLRPLTDHVPKAMVKVHNIPIIKNQIQIAKKNNFKNIYAVTGYNTKKIQFSELKKIYNRNYDKTNMVHSLFIALKRIIKNRSDLIISYSDIVYNTEVVEKLIKSKNEISVVCDDKWKKYWALRFKNPLCDAESCKINKNNKILDIGQKVKNYSKINSQYIGLIKINYSIKRRIYNILKSEYSNRKKLSNILNSKYYSDLYLTDLLQYLILNKFKISALRIKGNWVEIDSLKDYKLALNITKANNNLIKILR